MNCLQCGAPLEKNDIFCIKCETPVLTDDDIILMPNAETTKFVNEAQYKDPVPYVDNILYTDEIKSATEKFSAGQTADKDVQPINTVVTNGDTKQYDLPSGSRIKKGGNRKAIIITAVIVCIVVFGFGLFLIFSSPESVIGEPEAETPVTDPGENTENVDVPVPVEPVVPPPSLDVTSIVLLSNGRVQTEFHTMVNVSVYLQALLEPEGADAEIFWISSDPEVIEVMSTGSNGNEAIITGIAAGVADIIVIAGNVEISYVVFVDNMPFHVQLEKAIADEEKSVWLTFAWVSTQASGEETLFERASGSFVWYMEDASGRSEVHPTFGSDNNALTIELPDTTRVFYLFADGSGHLSNPDGTEKEDFIWSFMTTLIEPEG